MKLKISIPEQTQDINIVDIIKQSIVKYGDKYEKPEPLITVIEGVKEKFFLNYGGISGFFGKQKSRKTFKLSTIMAAAVGNCLIDGRLRAYTHGKQHYWFDTEQSRYYVNRSAYRVVRILNLEKHPDNFHLLSIKKYPPEDKIRIIEHIIDTEKEIGLLIIDTLSDLVYNINDLDECNKLIFKLMQWVDTTNCHIACALHINPFKKGDDEKPRGHLGTELQNRVESSVIIEKKTDKMSLIKPRDFRDDAIKPYALIVDEWGIPRLIDSDEIDEESF